MFTATGQLSKAASASCSFSTRMCECVLFECVCAEVAANALLSRQLVFLSAFLFFFVCAPLLPHSFGTHTKNRIESLACKWSININTFAAQQLRTLRLKVASNLSPPLAPSLSGQYPRLFRSMCAYGNCAENLKHFAVCAGPLAKDLKCWRAVHK